MKNQTFRNILCSAVLYLCTCHPSGAQTTILPDTNAQHLSQYLVGTGVSISNFKFTGATGTAGFFKVQNASPSIGIDSGIVLSTGYIKTGYRNNCYGINNAAYDGPFGQTRASSSVNAPGDSDLTRILPANFDAAVLEFDFVPTGDSIAFKYVFGSEEYPMFNCTEYNDLFAFFISGPGISGQQNIALVPGTNIPVAINSVNSGMVDPTQGIGGTMQVCGAMGPGSPFVNYYVNNSAGQTIGYNGFTKVLVAAARVQPCQVYHLKLAIADGMDRLFDSGVFLEAKSLQSAILRLQSGPLVTSRGKPYVVEGCTNGGVWVKRQHTSSYTQQVNLTYAGTAQNGVDIAQLPGLVTIPAGDSGIFLPITAIQDNLPEGTETLRIYISNACAAGSQAYADSIEVLVEEFQKLNITPESPISVCKSSPLQLKASGGFASYTWSPAAVTSSDSMYSPVISTTPDSSYIFCTAATGTCMAKDSVRMIYKKLQLVQKQDILCRNTATGKIVLEADKQWKRPVRFWVNQSAPQVDSFFTRLSAGSYIAKVQDSTGCIDSVQVNIGLSPNYLRMDSSLTTLASCSDSLSGGVSLFASGGLLPYRFSVNGGNLQTSSNFHLPVGNHYAVLKDAGNCYDTTYFAIGYNNTITLEAGNDTAICSGGTVALKATSNTGNVQWNPAPGLSSTTIANPTAAPVVTTTYLATAKNGFCSRQDSVKIIVHELPVANAGNDTAICAGSSVRLNGSGGMIYKWYPSTYLENTLTANPKTSPQNDITYQLKVISPYNCLSANTASISVKVIPPVVVSAGHDTVIASGQQLQLIGKQLQDSSAKLCVWNPLIGLSDSKIMTPVTTLTQDQTYRLTLRTPEGCEGSASVHIKVYQGPDIYVPTGFTPNKDGKNDVLRPITVGIKSFKQFVIFNRWGQPVFRSTIPENGWDGKVNGLVQSNQTFVWAVEGVDYNNKLIQRKGSVVVVQ